MSMSLTTEGKIAAIALTAGVVVGLGAGMWLGWTINRPQKSLETPAPAIIQSDGSHALERRPEANPQPKHQLPAGSKLVRQVSVEVMPRTSGSAPEAKESPRPVTVDLSLVEMPDKTQRVVASSPDGEIVGGVDIPVQPVVVPHEQKWAVSMLVGYDVYRNRRVYGAMAQRTAGPFTLQAGAIGSTVFVGAGVRF